VGCKSRPERSPPAYGYAGGDGATPITVATIAAAVLLLLALTSLALLGRRRFRYRRRPQ
jgi:hypothetical protein